MVDSEFMLSSLPVLIPRSNARQSDVFYITNIKQSMSPIFKICQNYKDFSTLSKCNLDLLQKCLNMFVKSVLD